MSKAMSLQQLREELGPQLRRPEQVTPPVGLATGWAPMDQFLSWRGFPKGEITLMIQEAGGATALWTLSAARTTQKQQWVAWMENETTRLMPWNLRHQGVDLSRLLVVAPAPDLKQKLWALQELLALGLFEMVTCDLGGQKFKIHQLLKLRQLALRQQTAVVLISSCAQWPLGPPLALALRFHSENVIIERALHRPTPHILERRDLYANTLPQLAAGRRALCG